MRNKPPKKLGHSITGIIAVSACLVLATTVHAQQLTADLPPGTVAGVIVDAATGDPLGGSAVLLEPTPLGAIRASGTESTWIAGASTYTDEAGRYVFTSVAQGTYRLTVRRLGYRPATVLLDLTETRTLRVSVGLTVEPIRLEPEVGAALAPPSFAAPDPEAASASDTRLAAERSRQMLFLESDVRTLSERDAMEAVTLAEVDVFRALQRLPGVTTRDEYTAELWTRGAPWSHTRVYFDGMPLFNPVHSAGVFSGLNPDGIGSVFFHPGARSASTGDGAAGVLFLNSRRWQRPQFGGSAGLSVASARMLLGGPISNAGAWTVAARRSYVDLLTGLVSESEGRIPYAYLDLTGRVDIQTGDNSILTGSWLLGRDAVWGTIPDLLRDNRGRWGNAAGRISYSMSLGSLQATQTLGFSRFSGNMSVLQFVTSPASNSAMPTHAPVDNRLTYLTLRSRIEPREAASENEWSAGYDLEYQRQHFMGPYPRPYPTVAPDLTFGRWAEMLRLAVWGEKRWSLNDLTLQLGLRSEFAGTVANSTPVMLAPRVSARYALTPQLFLSAGFVRSRQYTQAVAPAGPVIGPNLHLTDFWLLASDTIPAISSDVATIGGEVWLGTGWIGSVTAYTRHATGVAIPDPTPGLRRLDEGIFVQATNRAAGVEISLRRLVGPITTSVAYAFTNSEMSTAQWTFPATSARRHTIDATLTTRFGNSLWIGGAFMAASGAPFTRVHLGPVECVSGEVACPDTLFITTLVDEPAGAVAPYLASLDFFGEWVKSFRSWRLGVVVQVKNLLSRRNAVTYLGTYSQCTQPSQLSRTIAPNVCDRFHQGLPLLPLVGLYVRF